ncbi:uncharacterized protein LOC127872522 [Dreissena polymorpha]|uniref:uncharacterized protein LOC127872522 n=1 Tax=Dreissena polymorpha TaxID=45954 RepID=UPI002263FD27|nr:uncharacterized protein LOC127872522 [Dreissena polymorpha]
MFTAGRVSNTNTQSLVTVAPSIAFDPKTGVIPVNKAGEGNIISGNEVANASTDDKTTSFFKEGVSVMLIMVGSAFAILTFIAGFGIAVRIFKPSSKRVRVRDMPHTRRMDDYD